MSTSNAAWTPERALALLQAAERIGIRALGWMPYTDEVPEAQIETLRIDLDQVTADLDLIRDALTEARAAVLAQAEEVGRAS